MCGIVGYIGGSSALPILLEGLERLSYRGYDSAGVAVIAEGNEFYLEKMAGKVQNLKSKVDWSTKGIVGIGHTRWATHGEPSDVNAHPHSDSTGNIVLVQNGIIENYLELKDELIKKGHTFETQTDTEIVSHLIEDRYENDIVQAVQEAVKAIRGSFAIVVLDKREPDKIVVAKLNPPLIIGLGDGENIVASDIPAVLPYTRKVIPLEDEEMAIIRRDAVTLMNFDGDVIEDRSPTEINWSVEQAQKEGYPHFMLKEIYEQPGTISDTLRSRLYDNGKIMVEGINFGEEYIKSVKKINIVACGTAWHAGLVGKYIFEELLRIPVEVDLGSEYRYRNPIVDEGVLTIAISQSGETADTIASIKESQEKGSRILAITNTVGSTIDRISDDVLYTWAGPEIAVASTKAFVGQLTAICVTCLYFMQSLDSGDRYQKIAEELRQLPAKVEKILDNVEPIKNLAKQIKDSKSIFFIGRNLDEPIAKEGALKLKEISYIHAESYPAGELKHGTIALIEDGTPVIAVAVQDDVYEKMASNIQEVVARRANVIALTFEDKVEELKKHAKFVYPIPRINPVLSPILTVIPLQLLAYYTALERGCDIDQPRNLAKSVTVE
jgi:glucosamine--fructose-6-phosphate aminotransferase (isomerizing)